MGRLEWSLPCLMPQLGWLKDGLNYDCHPLCLHVSCSHGGFVTVELSWRFRIPNASVTGEAALVFCDSAPEVT